MVKVSPGTFISILDASLVPISDMRKKPLGTESSNFIALIFRPNEIGIEYTSNTLCFSTSVPSSGVSASATLHQSRVLVHLKDLVNLVRCCCDNTTEDVEIEEYDDEIFFKSNGFEGQIKCIDEASIFGPSQLSQLGSTMVSFIADSDILFSAFHQFLMTPIPKKIVFSVSSVGNIVLNNTEEDRAEYPLSTHAEIAPQFVSNLVCTSPFSCAILGINLSPICSFLAIGGKCQVTITADSWIVFRRKFISNSDGELRVYVSSIDLVSGG